MTMGLLLPNIVAKAIGPLVVQVSDDSAAAELNGGNANPASWVLHYDVPTTLLSTLVFRGYVFGNAAGTWTVPAGWTAVPPWTDSGGNTTFLCAFRNAAPVVAAATNLTFTFNASTGLYGSGLLLELNGNIIGSAGITVDGTPGATYTAGTNLSAANTAAISGLSGASDLILHIAGISSLTPNLTAASGPGLTSMGICSGFDGGPGFALGKVVTGSPTSIPAASLAFTCPTNTAIGIGTIALKFASGGGAPTVPGTPTGVTATGGSGQATVSWTAPSNGGSTITSNIVTTYLNGVAQSPPITTNSTPLIIVTGLTNGQSYTFTVAAVNSVGTGATSSLSNSVTPNTATFTPNVPSSFLSQLATSPTFSDNFPGNTLNSSKWNPNYQGNEGGNVNGVATHAANVAVSNGVTLTLASLTSGANIDTHGKFAFNQGYLQFIGTFPVASEGGIANWGAFWFATVLQGHPGITEGDVAESLNYLGSNNTPPSQPRTTVFGTNHAVVGSLTPSLVSGNPAHNVNYAGTQHTYGMFWAGDVATFIYDGQVVFTVTDSRLADPNNDLWNEIYITEGQDNTIGGYTHVGESIKCAQVAYWPLA